jgi:hypothetical protein
MFRQRCIWIGALSYVIGFGLPVSHAQVVYDPAANFSATNNPNGVWSYGWTQSLGSAFNFDTSFQNGSGLNFWVGPFPNGSSEFMPYVAHNGTASTINYLGFLPYPSGRLGLHPGDAGQYAVIRFSSPQTTSINVAASFFRIDPNASTDVHILHNGLAVFSGQSEAPFSWQRSVQSGDTIDFVVGFGGNGFGSDSTGLTATITPVPEPGALALTGLAIVAAHCRRLRKHKVRAIAAHLQ